MLRTSIPLALLLWGLAVTSASPESRQRVEAVRAFVAERLARHEPCPALDTKIDVAWADLNGDGRAEALVYVAGPSWCGSGGCDLLVLERTKSGFRERGDISLSRAPIAVLPTRSHGWREISVFVSGGGILPGYSSAVPFDGARYAENPSVAPARPLRSGVKLRNLLDRPGSVSGLRLYPVSAAPPPPNLPEGVVAIVGRNVEFRVPKPFDDCWEWVSLTPLERTAPLAYLTSRTERDTSGREWGVTVFEAEGPGRVELEFALIPAWQAIYTTGHREAAVKIWRAKAVVP